MYIDQRQRLQELAWDIYQGDYAKHVRLRLQSRVTGETLSKYAPYISPRHNILRRIAEVLAVVYRRPPRRYSKPKGAVDTLRRFLPDFDLLLDRISKLTFALADVFVMPYWDDENSRIYLDIVPPHMIKSVEYYRSSIRSVTVSQEIGDVVYYADGRFEIVESALDGTRVVKESGDTGLGALPFARFSLEPRDYLSPWGIYANSDLIEGTLEIGILEAYHGYTSYLRSFRLPTISADELERSGRATPPEVEIGPDTILNYSIDPVELADPADQFWDSIVKQVEDLAASRDISPTIMFRKVQKLDEVKAASEELRNRWESQVKIFRGAEGALLDIIFALLRREGKWSGSNPSWRIDYMLPSPVLSDPRQNLEVLDKGIRLGVDSPADYLLRENPDLRDQQEAWSVIEQNIEDRARLVKEMRALNMPADPGAVGNDPSVNGALQQDQQGYNGPPAVSPELAGGSDATQEV